MHAQIVSEAGKGAAKVAAPSLCCFCRARGGGGRVCGLPRPTVKVKPAGASRGRQGAGARVKVPVGGNHSSHAAACCNHRGRCLCCSV
jgi:hypothetical protein